MAISNRLALARRTTLMTCLCTALAAGAGARHADASPIPHTIPVTNCLDDGSDGSLRKAIEGAGDGDTIDMSGLACSLITLQSGELQSSVASLTLRGPGIDALTIDGNNGARVLEGTYLDVSDLTIAHGVDLNGSGGCISTMANLSLSHVRVTACLAAAQTTGAAGGAIFAGKDLTMHDSIISASRASGNPAGGGGVIVGGAAHLYDSVIAGNRAEADQAPAYGGGIFALGLLTLDRSQIDGNTAQSTSDQVYGGGIHSSGADVLISASTISNNTAHSNAATGYGGGVNSGTYSVATYGNVVIDRSTVSGNTVDSECNLCLVSGGGVQAGNGVSATYSTVVANHALCDIQTSSCQADGGGLAARGSQSQNVITLKNSTVSTNAAIGGTQAPGFGIGGGLFLWTAKTFSAHNSTIAFNHASDSAGGVFVNAMANAQSEMISTIVSNNDSASGTDDITAGLFGAVITGANDLVVQASALVQLPSGTIPSDPGLLPLTQSDGGTTATHPLPSGSAAIDNGANPDALGCDQRGFPYRRVSGASADIGAYEYQGEPHIFADGFDGPNVACPSAP